MSQLEAVLNNLKHEKTFILLESLRHDCENRYSYIFTQPARLIRCHEPRKLKACFSRLKHYLERGYYTAGFLSYEAGYAFEKSLGPKPRYSFPLIWMGAFKSVLIFDHAKNKFIKAGKEISVPSCAPGAIKPDYQIQNLRLNLSRAEYLKNIRRIKRYIAGGDTYQVNYTLKYKFNFSGCPFSFYQDLTTSQPVNYAAFIKSGDFTILSLSPELFFKKTKSDIFVRPMKGTISRGEKREEDEKNKRFLQKDIKNRAENLMIVDLLRNDLGRISRTGTVSVKKLFRVEKYKTLFQMTSTVKSKLKKPLSILELFSSIFPSGSVTGAPKIHTMKLIRKIEKEERKIYTGSIGFISPKQNAVFNVAIRTILLEKGRAELGVGGGITYGSAAASEYEECKLKGKFLTYPTFELLETLRYTKKDGFYLLELHLERLKTSADFFGFPYNRASTLQYLKTFVRNCRKDKTYRIRLLLFPDGKLLASASRIPKTDTAITTLPKITLSPLRTSSTDPFLYHKTTHRALYDTEHKKYKKSGYYDIIFQNEKRQLTEGAISNLFIKEGNTFFTPPTSCGLLCGVFRTHLLKTQPRKFREKILKLVDLRRAKEIYIANSVRGMIRVRFEG
ncbi:MAG: aminodeoxychorismate synthase component I [Candidatus Omnitrophica bacterium]|nr:aminodeoxychorismate synthase component I [Candidatus Omnitrophota bacterium]MBU1925578.1 aminodeoxychorismate synthase component I [Candidatus Omnitrophota bacterium]